MAPLRIIGPHPVSGAEMKLMAGRFGQYITNGTTNATVPKGEDGMTISVEAAAALIDVRAAMPPKPGKKPVKKAAVKKPAAKKAAPKKKPAAVKAQ
jgi:DNA topoisomerase-1